MKFSHQSIDEKLAFAQLALSNAVENTEIAALMAVFGYDAARIAVG